MPACTDCPPATLDDVKQGTILPCTNASGTDCEPLKRDLGLDANEQRLCLIRQADRTSTGGTCGTPTNDGWYYTPPTGGSSCPELIFSLGSAGSLIDDGSTAVFQCLSGLCPPERQCGPTATPDSICCDSTVTADAPLGLVCDQQDPSQRTTAGTCVPATE